MIAIREKRGIEKCWNLASGFATFFDYCTKDNNTFFFLIFFIAVWGEGPFDLILILENSTISNSMEIKDRWQTFNILKWHNILIFYISHVVYQK